MSSGIKGVVCVLALMITGTANAWDFDGNPFVNVWVDRAAGDIASANVIVEAVRVAKCGGGETVYNVDQTLNLADGYVLTIAGGDLCGISVDYGSSMRVTKEGGWVADHHEATTTIEVTESGASSTVLTPLQVVQGPVSGQFPRVYVQIN